MALQTDETTLKICPYARSPKIWLQGDFKRQKIPTGMIRKDKIMNVELLQYNPDCEKVVAAAAKLCYSSSEIDVPIYP